jgi:hypothetical protein
MSKAKERQSRRSLSQFKMKKWMRTRMTKMRTWKRMTKMR